MVSLWFSYDFICFLYDFYMFFIWFYMVFIWFYIVFIWFYINFYMIFRGVAEIFGWPVCLNLNVFLDFECSTANSKYHRNSRMTRFSEFQRFSDVERSTETWWWWGKPCWRVWCTHNFATLDLQASGQRPWHLCRLWVICFVDQSLLRNPGTVRK